MKKTLSYLSVFGIGVIVCGVGLKAVSGVNTGPFFTNDSGNKQAVLASLNTTPSPIKHFTGDSVVADAAAKLEPAVVTVHTIGRAVQQSNNPFSADPMFRQFFGDQGGQSDQAPAEAPRGAGSGVIISPDGYILTNNHVVQDTTQVTVNVGDKGYTAKVVGSDSLTDIAVVKIDPKGVKLPTADLGDSDSMRIGDWAIAIGNPLNIGTTVTLGIVSAVNRKGLSAEGHSLNSVIQTDAAINPGNSGGALANINGQVIGINEAIYSPTGSYVGIGFAIPINAAKKIAYQLIKDGKIVRPYLGVSYAPLKEFPAQARQQMGITVDGDDGVIVQQVRRGSPAAAAGLQTYDVILQANRQKINDTDSLNNIIQGLKVGDTLALLISRDGQTQIVTVTLKERPQDYGQRPTTQQVVPAPVPDQQSPF
ncbi:peptidase S1 [Capsulimonas corticalis]|uniref:Peptidase S1 n=1 Tax=Capsulimonas corticalis TaxID=2219043 RepID=A0A402CYN9_9BACT|nr:trypsin-like peptidase domain-containing protein [Capsulimonas corticalis]BDI31266.1 peptidase S1 [Capsulimonas corticalis]